MTTVGEAISRVRNVLKAVKEDPFLTDRLIYSLIMKVAKTLIKREERIESLFKYKSLFKELPCVELIEVDKIEACCMAIKTQCTFRRTKEKLPKLMEIGGMQMIRSVTSLDYSKKATQTYPTVYTNMTRTSGFKYIKQNYYWYLDGYIYIPNVTWEAARIQAIFDEDISDDICTTEPGECTQEQDRELAIPEHLYTEIEQMVIQQLLTAGQIPSDGPDDSQNVMR